MHVDWFPGLCWIINFDLDLFSASFDGTQKLRNQIFLTETRYLSATIHWIFTIMANFNRSSCCRFFVEKSWFKMVWYFEFFIMIVTRLIVKWMSQNHRDSKDITMSRVGFKLKIHRRFLKNFENFIFENHWIMPSEISTAFW